MGSNHGGTDINWTKYNLLFIILEKNAIYCVLLNLIFRREEKLILKIISNFNSGLCLHILNTYFGDTNEAEKQITEFLEKHSPVTLDFLEITLEQAGPHFYQAMIAILYLIMKIDADYLEINLKEISNDFYVNEFTTMLDDMNVYFKQALFLINNITIVGILSKLYNNIGYEAVTGATFMLIIFKKHEDWQKLPGNEVAIN